MLLARHVPLPAAPRRSSTVSFAEELPSGRLVELSGAVGSARTSLALAAVRAGQSEGEPVAWIQPAAGPFYPPDAAACGVDLAALAVVHVPFSAGEAGPFRAAEILLRSGAFGLVVLDRRGAAGAPSDAMQGRLQALAREHDVRVLVLTDRSADTASLGPLVSLRVEPRRVRLGGGRFAIEPVLLKSKNSGPLELATERRRGPWSPP
jgi:recombination protein RecA